MDKSDLKGLVLVVCSLLTIAPYAIGGTMGWIVGILGFLSMFSIWVYDLCKENREFNDACTRISKERLMEIRNKAFFG